MINFSIAATIRQMDHPKFFVALIAKKSDVINWRKAIRHKVLRTKSLIVNGVTGVDGAGHGVIV